MQSDAHFFHAHGAGVLGPILLGLFWTLGDLIGKWTTGHEHSWWSGCVAAILTAPILWRVAQGIRRKMSPQQRQGDVLLMTHHTAFIPLRVQPYLYLLGGLIGFAVHWAS